MTQVTVAGVAKAVPAVTVESAAPAGTAVQLTEGVFMCREGRSPCRPTLSLVTRRPVVRGTSEASGVPVDPAAAVVTAVLRADWTRRYLFAGNNRSPLRPPWSFRELGQRLAERVGRCQWWRRSRRERRIGKRRRCVDLFGGSLTLLNSTLSDGSTIGSAGAAEVLAVQPITVRTRSPARTVVRTAAGVYGGGGNATIINSTIAYDDVASGGTGGGLDVVAGTATLDNTIVALNTNGTGSRYRPTTSPAPSPRPARTT